MKSHNLINSLKSGFSLIIIPVLLAVSFLIYIYILGNPANFQGGDPNNHPLPGNYLGIVYKGGYIVPILLALLLMVITYTIERFITIKLATGRGNIKNFVLRIRHFLNRYEIAQAVAACDEQKGSVANVVRAGLIKYDDIKNAESLDPDKKVLLMQKDIEETTQLEMPMLEKNLVIISTIASIATLMGLLGTVLGMIKAFAALATAGAPDAVALANGISEALINTALGIGTSALAIVMYNYFTSSIDKLTYSIDEVAYSIVQSVAASDSKKVVL